MEGKESEACSLNSSYIRVGENESSFSWFDFITHHVCLEPCINTPALWCCTNVSKHSPCPRDITAGLQGGSQSCEAGQTVGQTRWHGMHSPSQVHPRLCYMGFMAEVKHKSVVDGRQAGTLWGDFFCHDLEGRL